MVIVIQSSIANASKGIFLTYSSAVKLSTDLEFLKLTNDSQSKQIIHYKDIISGQNDIVKLQDTKISGLTKDKKLQEEKANKLQDIYTKTKQELIDEQESKPSRFTWFSIGSVSTLIMGLFAIFSIK